MNFKTFPETEALNLVIFILKIKLPKRGIPFNKNWNLHFVFVAQLVISFQILNNRNAALSKNCSEMKLQIIVVSREA